jgi:hypothetical protein
MKAKFIKIFVLTILTACFTTNAQTGDKANDKLFPPIDIKAWEKTPCVSRLATEKETTNGTALLYYDKKKNPDAKPYNMTLPKLATHFNFWTKKDELVVVIQIVQTAKDTMVGYRPLTGSNGASVFRDFRFLNDEEVKKAVGK